MAMTRSREKSILSMVKMVLVTVIALMQGLHDQIERDLKEE
jgi:hypothetical protein